VGENVTTIVVPVFNAPEQLARCLLALHASLERGGASVVVIDDASTDPEVKGLTDRLPDDWVLVRNQTNLGFVATANFGLALAGRDNVILLNSDTQVTPGWLQAIENCAASDARIASVTPLTNHGEIASIPRFCSANPWPRHPENWSQAACRSGPPRYPDLPTAVGFCMFLRREAIDQLGGFDEVAFGRGYGEENDWCCRASAAGWRHVLCDHAFVAHEGGASFEPLGLKPGGQAMEMLLARHPTYLDRVTAFIKADPLAERRNEIIGCYQQIAENPSDRKPG
jgi:GT2 family glycosyltransferase